MIIDMKEKRLELYLHIPFCVKKCAYCDFLSAPADEAVKIQYVDALIKEIKLKAELYQAYSVSSLFIGGGTPSVLLGEDIFRLMGAIYNYFFIEKNAEITIECNPGTLNPKKAAHYKSAGINRISLGLQSVRREELALLGRIHTYEQFLQSYDILRKAGFDNVNVDVMSGLPGQSLADWQDTLKKVVDLRPEHISAYSLIIEEGTLLYASFSEDEARRQAGEDPRFLPDEETERIMYQWTHDYLSAHGYLHYEISNYARPGRACRHNIGYWRRENYLGLGLGSASLVENERFTNTSDLEEYLAGSWEKRDCISLSRREQMEEFMFLGLRMMEGILRKDFRDCFGVELEAVYGDTVTRLCRQGLLKQEAGRIFLTPEGISVSNYVMAEFIGD